MYWKAFIRVIKSMGDDHDFGVWNVTEDRCIEADSKEEVKKYLAETYPCLFPDGKVYTRETKDQAQFFYAVIYPLYDHEVEEMGKSWKCENCQKEYDNKIGFIPYTQWIRQERKTLTFCGGEFHTCYEEYMKNNSTDFEGDNPYYVNVENPIYIYKITEKSTGKSYVGKTANAVFFRWWNHLKHSSSPFGLYLAKTKLSEWTFEVLEELDGRTSNEDVLLIESKYIVQFDCIANGYNTVISNKKALEENKDQLHLDI